MTNPNLTGFIKYMTEEEFELLMQELMSTNSKPLQMCVKCLGYLALRVSDAVQLNLKNINSDFSQINYEDEKTGVPQEKTVPPTFRKQLGQYVREFRKEFREGYLFPPFGNNGRSRNLHLQPSTIRDFFKKFRRKHGFDIPYHTCKDGKKLFRISPHTLKHHCAWRYYKASGNNLVATIDFLGHKNGKFTVHYIRGVENKIQQADILEKAFFSN